MASSNSPMAGQPAKSIPKLHSVLDSKFPVFLPSMDALTMSDADFDAHIQSLCWSRKSLRSKASDDPSTSTNAKVEELIVKDDASHQPTLSNQGAPKLQSSAHRRSPEYTLDALKISQLGSNEMLTENSDVAFRSTTSPLVDLFYEMEEHTSGSRLRTLLDAAWAEDATATLKIIFNGRSIHLGKSSRTVFYRCYGWLAENHPQTLIMNLRWLPRPVIEKKVKKEGKEDAAGEDEDMVIVDTKDAQEDQSSISNRDISEYDVKYGVSHGYWKDLLNLLTLAANDKLKVDADLRSVFNVHAEKKLSKRDYSHENAKKGKEAFRSDRHSQVVSKLENDPVYRALHLTVARLFAEQLKLDIALLHSGRKGDLKRISLAAKWAPTFAQFHDKHTFIASSIAEILHPQSEICPDLPKENRELYLRQAREAYRKLTVSPLRKFLEVVERDITVEKFENIKYDRVPSLAMARYQGLFAKKDFERFDQYIENVAQGKSRISGATLLPSTLVHSVSVSLHSSFHKSLFRSRERGASAQLVARKLLDIQRKVADGQWKTLVQRIRDSGKLESSIAVCDVSGSMGWPVFSDGTCPMDSAVGLSLLLAEVVEPPFGGSFITFSYKPSIQHVGGPQDERTLEEKVKHIMGSEWGMNTNFVSVFEDLILPLAIENKIKQEDMVKQVFVFSDMQFDEASCSSDSSDRWTTSFERIQEKFKDAGYEIPKLIFWNLAAGRPTAYSRDPDDDTAPKPVTADVPGTALVSGYSQGQMKMFLENGQFEDAEVEEEVTAKDEDSDDDLVMVRKSKRVKMDPLIIVKKAISHKAYDMLKVVD